MRPPFTAIEFPPLLVEPIGKVLVESVPAFTLIRPKPMLPKLESQLSCAVLPASVIVPTVITPEPKSAIAPASSCIGPTDQLPSIPSVAPDGPPNTSPPIVEVLDCDVD